MSQTLQISRYFTREIHEKGLNPYDAITWEKRTASLTNAKGETIFEQKDVEVPQSWSQTATSIVANKYFHGKMGAAGRENSVRQVVKRISSMIAHSGFMQGYFDDESRVIFRDELAYILLNQMGAFNSPVFFNVGCHEYEPLAQAGNWHWDQNTGGVRYETDGYYHPQCSACFINSVEDSMEGIMELAHTEALLFKFGSGTGTNFSTLRSSKESVSGGGKASGPLSFMKGLDAFAGVIKSGGKTRRAAKMAVLNINHPDIEEFIDCKLKEDKKAQALMREGYDGSSGPDSEAYSSVFYQNANNSVSVTDGFMEAVEQNWKYETRAVTTNQIAGTYQARDLMRKIAQATWECGDPGMQYTDTINKWHTCRASGRINSSNPCSEYLFLDNSACNLFSWNLMKFVTPAGRFDYEAFRKGVALGIIAMDILVDMSGYPTEKIARNSHDYRPLGMGYCNLGALLMSKGIAYDSDEGRKYAAAITALMTSQAYLSSTGMAKLLNQIQPADIDLPVMNPKGVSGGWFPGYLKNRESFLEVMRAHQAAANNLSKSIEQGSETEEIAKYALALWDSVVDRGDYYGFRNSQVTVLAPTGTIGFLMDCDTTGVEPELSLIKYKKLVGGGYMKIVNETVPAALRTLGYSEETIQEILAYIDQNGTIEGAPLFDPGPPSDLAVFDTSFKPEKGTRYIAYSGHINMMAAVQPFLSGAISKTVNMPSGATVEEIEKVYIDAWKKGLKAVAIYRDGSKSNQVLVTKKEDEKKKKDPPLISVGEPGTAKSPFAAAVKRELAGETPFEVYPLGSSLKTLLDDQDAPPVAVRHRLPNRRASVTYKFAIAGHEGYLTVGLYKAGQPGEIFIQMAKEGSTISGIMDCFALVFSIALQHGAPLATLVSKLEHSRFEPSGWTGDPDIGYAKSIMDYLARLLRLEFLEPKQGKLFSEQPMAGNGTPITLTPNIMAPVVTNGNYSFKTASQGLGTMIDISDSPACPECGAIMVRNATCYRCMECGGSSGCS